MTQAFADPISNISSSSGRVLASAVLGGTITAATGGKFANGAVTAAFSYAFNEEVHARTAHRRALWAQRHARAFEEITSELRFDTIDDAEENFFRLTAEPTKDLGLEFGANVYQELVGGRIKYRLGAFASSTRFDHNGYGSAVNVGADINPQLVAFVHTHPAQSGPGLSYPDISRAIDRGIDAFARDVNGVRYSFSLSRWQAAGQPSPTHVYYNQRDFSR